MRVSRFSTLSSTMLLLASSVLFIGLYFSLKQLHQADQKLQDYNHLKSLANIDLTQTIARYLDSGDTLVLSEAESLLQTMISTAKQQNLDTISTRLATLYQAINSDYRALGKLSGNEMGLLTNAERQMMGYAESAIDYGLRANNIQATSTAYIENGAKMLASLAALTLQRENYFNKTSDISYQAYSDEFSVIAQQALVISTLPLLGILEKGDPDEDEFILGDPEPQADLAEEIQSELLSLSRRYPRELNSTNTLLQKRRVLEESLSNEVAQLAHFIAQAENKILIQRGQVTAGVEMTLYGIACLLLVLALVNHLAMKPVVLTPLHNLRAGFKALVENNHFAPLTLADKGTEIGEIVDYFNRLIAVLSDEEQQKVKQLGIVSSSLDSVSQQICSIHGNSERTEQQVNQSQQLIIQLSEVTEQLKHIASDVEHNASMTESVMNDSQLHVEAVLSANAQTAQAIGEGHHALTNVMMSVTDVSSILEVIHKLAAQTNLLALNAAIESARAGIHGRGFAVVADEVRSLAMQTQSSLKEITAILNTLKQSSQHLAVNIDGIQKASEHQQQIAVQLLASTKSIRLQAQNSASVASSAGNCVRQQSKYMDEFTGHFKTVKHQVDSTYQLATAIELDITKQINTIVSTLSTPR